MRRIYVPVGLKLDDISTAMPRSPAGGQPGSAGPQVVETQPAPSGAWADQCESAPSNAPAASASTPSSTIRMAVGSATDTPASGTKTAGGIDAAALAMLLKDSIAAAVEPLQRELGALSERVRVAEIAASRAGSDAGSDSTSTRSSESYDVLGDEEVYLPIDPASNNHFGAADISNTGELKPHRHDLYGHRPWMVLTKGGNENGGNLGFALSYAEPL